MQDIMNREVLSEFVNNFWFVPSDVLQRSVESRIWSNYEIKTPTLDIGCGNASYTKYLFQGRKIDVGLELNEKEAATARKSNLYKKVVCASASEVPFKEKTFNTVISNSTFEHIENDVLAVREVARVLRKGGKFMFTVPLLKLEKEVKEIVNDNGSLKRFNERLSHLHYREYGEWKNILRKEGLLIEKSIFYFPRDVVKVWYRLFVLSTLQLRKREMWSYLKDSKYFSFLPKKMIAKLVYFYLYPYYRDSFSDEGCQMFVASRKVR